MSRKKGFTLIELLAVIVILAIIVIIATPIVLNVVKDAKRNAAIDSVYGIEEAIKYAYGRKILDGISEETRYDCNENKECVNLTNEDDKLIVSGELPTGGYLIVNKDGVVEKAVNLIIGDYVCSKDGVNEKIDCLEEGQVKVILTYENNGGSGCDNKKVINGNLYGTLCTPIKENYTFLGWYKEPSLTNKIDSNTKVEKSTKHTIYASWVQTVTNYAYTGNIQTFTALANGYYNLETWGAQGGSVNNDYIGGYGGYSTGNIYLTKGSNLYVVIGQKGSTVSGNHNNSTNFAYNGGGKGRGTDGYGNNGEFAGGGGGATHIGTKSEVLNSLENSKDDIIIVAGGGGGAVYYNHDNNYISLGSGGSGGGAQGGSSYHFFRLAAGVIVDITNEKSIGGNQTEGSGFGRAISSDNQEGAGGGGGYYGGFFGYYGGGGGSGYIGNTNLINKHMTCYKCTTSDNISTKTYETSKHSSNAISDYAKEENGYARITYIGDSMSLSENTVTYENNGGSGCTSSKVTNGDIYGNLCIPIKNGYVFAGWYKESSLTNKILSTTKVTTAGKHTLYAKWIQSTTNYTYTGNIQTFTAPEDGYYKLEVWGAQGASATLKCSNCIGGYGGYATGVTYLNASDNLYITVGGQGGSYGEYKSGVEATAIGGYNGGGYGHVNASDWAYRYLYAGGGATHIATSNRGVIANYSNYKYELLIVAGGGGAASSQEGSSNYISHTIGGSGGGINGNQLTIVNRIWNGVKVTTSWDAVSTQSSGESFGNGHFNYNPTGTTYANWGGGGGLYGGLQGGGGSGYIGNSDLFNKHMTCYNCTTSNNELTKTISTTSHSSTAIVDYAKEGNGYARITYVGE